MCKLLKLDRKLLPFQQISKQKKISDTIVCLSDFSTFKRRRKTNYDKTIRVANVSQR